MKCMFTWTGVFYKPSIACFVVWENMNPLWLYTEYIF